MKYLGELHDGLVGDRVVYVPGYKLSLEDQRIRIKQNAQSIWSASVLTATGPQPTKPTSTVTAHSERRAEENMTRLGT